MLLSISTTYRPATALGYLLHKNPSRAQEVELGFGRAHMFYPEANDERCTFVLLLDIDPVALVRGSGKDGGLLDQYVNDRPYAASSFLSVAIAKTLRTALGGRCEQRPDLVQQAIPLSALVTPLPVRGGPDLVERLFAPLGYRIEVETSACRFATTGRPSIGAAPRSSTATPRSLMRSGSTTRSVSTPAACSAASSRPCAGRRKSWSRSPRRKSMRSRSGRSEAQAMA